MRAFAGRLTSCLKRSSPIFRYRCEHENYRIEAKTLAAYCVVIHSGVNRLKDIPFYLEEYCDFLEKKGYKAQRSRRLLKDFLEFNEKINKAA